MQQISVDDVAAMIRAQLGKKLPPERALEADTKFEDVGLASLDISEIFFSLENHVGMELDPVPASGVKTIGGLVDVINTQVRAADSTLTQA